MWEHVDYEPLLFEIAMFIVETAVILEKLGIWNHFLSLGILVETGYVLGRFQHGQKLQLYSGDF